MNNLADRVEGMDGPCRETDAEIDRLLCPNVADGRAGNGVRMAPPYTASLDAVVALIEKELPGWAWKVGTCCVSDDGWVVPDFNCPKHGERLRQQFGGFAAGSPENIGVDVDKRPSGNPALALLAAFLRGYAMHLSATGKRHEAIAKRWLADPEVKEKMNAASALLRAKEADHG